MSSWTARCRCWVLRGRQTSASRHVTHTVASATSLVYLQAVCLPVQRRSQGDVHSWALTRMRILKIRVTSRRSRRCCGDWGTSATCPGDGALLRIVRLWTAGNDTGSICAPATAVRGFSTCGPRVCEENPQLPTALSPAVVNALPFREQAADTQKTRVLPAGVSAVRPAA